MEGIKKDMEAIKKNITEIEKKHGEALKATSKAVSSKAEDSLHKLMDTVPHPPRPANYWPTVLRGRGR